MPGDVPWQDPAWGVAEYRAMVSKRRTLSIEDWATADAAKDALPQTELVPPDPGPDAVAALKRPTVFADWGAVAAPTVSAPDRDAAVGRVACVTVEPRKKVAKSPVMHLVIPWRGAPEAIAGSARIFRWVTETQAWDLVGTSRAGAARYVFGRIAEPGTYGVFAIPGDPLACLMLRVLHGAGAVLAADRKGAARLAHDLLAPISASAPAWRQDALLLADLAAAHVRSGLPSAGGADRHHVAAESYAATLAAQRYDAPPPQFQLLDAFAKGS